MSKSDEIFIEEINKQNNILSSISDATETDPSEYGYSPDVDGMYEPVYPDLTQPPNLHTETYESLIEYSLLDKFKNIEKINSGYIYNQNDPYPVDAKIVQLEQHKPQVVFNASEINSARSMLACIESSSKINEVISLLDILSKRVEKRLVQLDNINATTMRYLYRLSSRININCVYYGGQSIYNKYNCIRCLDDDLINDTPVTLDQCLNCTRYEPVIGQVYDLKDEEQDKLHSSILLDDIQTSRINADDALNHIRVNQYHNVPDSILKKLDVPFINGDKKPTISWTSTTLNSQSSHILDYNSGYNNLNNELPSYEWESELSANEMLDIFEKSNYLSSYKNKKDTMLAVGRMLAEYDYHPTFIIGVMGHIQGEGNVGLFEKIHTGTYYFNAMKEYNHSNGESYYDYYQKNFSNQYIYDNKNLSEVKDLINNLYEIKIGSNRPLGFGLGCLQWTFERTQKLINIYIDFAGGKNTISKEKAYQAEAYMIKDELKGAYKKVYTHWFGTNNNKLSSGAAYNAGNNALIGYGLNPVYLTTNLPSSLSIWNNIAKQRGDNASKLFNAITEEINKK